MAERRGVRFPLWVDFLFSLVAWSFIVWITVFFTALIACVYLLHPWIDPHRELNHRLAMMWSRVLVSGTHGLQVEITGREHLPKTGPFVLMANHQSYADIPALYLIGGNFKWMALEILFKIPIFGWAMAMSGYISVPRGRPRLAIKALEQAKRCLDQGISIFLFPEGTRSRTGTFGRFQMGAFRLAVAAQVPIVPVVITGTRQFFPRGFGVFRFGVRPKIQILSPMPPPPADVRQLRRLNKLVRSRMMEVYREHLPEFR